MNNLFRNSAIRKYQEYRKAGTELNHKIINRCADGSIIEKSARALGLGKNRQLVLDSEDDLSVLMDYSLYEIREKGKSLVEIYLEKYGSASPMEQELLSAMVRSQTGLFKVTEIFPKRSQLSLTGLLEANRSITLTDINFSRTLAEEVVFFFRPIELDHYTMTSGVAFAFPGSLEKDLLRRWEDIGKKLDSAKRYAIYFKLSKQKGFTTEYR
jgi:hypothetical protein